MVYSAGLALLCDTVGRESLGEAMGYVTLAITAATFVGPSLGGILFDAGGERAVFGFAYAVIAFDITLRLAVVEGNKAGPLAHAVPVNGGPGSPYGSVSESAPLMRDASPHNHASAHHPDTPFLDLLWNSRILAALIGWLAVGAFLSSFDAILPIFVHSRFGWSPMGAGLIFLPLFVPNLAGPLYGRLVDSSRHGSRLLGTLGFLISAPPLILLRLVQEDDVRYAPWLLCGLLFLIGIGLAIAGPALMVEVFSAVFDMEGVSSGEGEGARSNVAQAYGLYNSALAMGQLLGPLFAGSMLSFFGWKTLTAACGVLRLFPSNTSSKDGNKHEQRGEPRNRNASRFSLIFHE
jgi:MFS family permease